MEKLNQMENNYYDSFMSYVKMIIESVKGENSAEHILIKNIYNVNICNDNDIIEMIIVTGLFESILNSLNENEKKALVKNLYSDFLKPIICNYSNGDTKSSLFLFQFMRERMKDITGYNALRTSQLLEENFSVVKIKKGR